MTRPRVPADQRQRTAQACESCKRRKQKCNGECPCNTCSRRSFTCIYSDREYVPSPADSTSLKRKAGDDSGTNSPSDTKEGIDVNPKKPRLHPTSLQRSNGFTSPYQANQVDTGADTSAENAARSLQQFSRRVDDGGAPPMSRGTTHSGDEEAVVYSQTRMLQDPTGRLLYIGDSGTLSYLQLIRMMVENVTGPSAFTTDPRRHKIVESNLILPPAFRPTHLLPDKTTTKILVDAFFVNTNGIAQVFDRETFMREVDMCYDNPLAADHQWLCLLNLVLAIGLMLATPKPGTSEAAIVETLRNDPYDRTEIFYQNAKSLNDPMHGFEDADFWSVQALLLMSIYMLTKSKRNAAFALLGMAVRSAYSLGLHREETMVIFSAEDRSLRQNLWKSLFVMDRFLSCSLGRPVAISEDECSGDTLRPSHPEADGEGFKYSVGFAATFSQIAGLGLEAAVRSCSAIGSILKRVYQHRKINTRLAQEIADVCKLWPKALAPILHWRQAAAASPSQGMAILHTNLFYCHSIVLLTRPFFLYILNEKVQRIQAGDSKADEAPASHARMGKFMEACIVASTHSVKLVQQAYEAGYLPRRDPSVIYFLFAATLILLSSEYALLYSSTTSPYIRQSIMMMAYCAETDPQAIRLLYILTTFKDVVARQQATRNLQALPFFDTGRASQPFVNGPLNTTSNMFPSTDTLPPLGPQPVSAAGYHNVTFPPAALPLPTAGSPAAPQLDHQRQMSASSLPSIANLTGPTPTTNTPAPAPPAAPSLNSEISFSKLLDLSALDGSAKIAAGSGEDLSSIPDEQIDFDALWAWPTPVGGTPRFGLGAGTGTSGGSVSAPGDGMADSVPLYGVVDG